jgi:SprT protein
MATEKVPFDRLKDFLPNNTYELVMPLITKHKVHLLIAKERLTKLGDYRHAFNNRNHRISVNSNLNKYSFLITLLHELGHLLAFEKYGNRIAPHGTEWKKLYAGLLHTFLQRQIFPEDVAAELKAILHNPGASSCAEESLLRVLRRYDKRLVETKTVEELPEGKEFKITNGRAFIRGQKMRKRIKCEEIATGKLYLFSPLFEVIQV